MTARQAGETPAETVWEGKYIKVVKQGTWEFVSRTRDVTAAVILAIHEGHVILVEQYRVPVGARCVELPAGLVGDETEGEEVAVAAIRELEEETGYRAGTLRLLTSFWTAPGFATELMHLYLATDLQPAETDRLGPDEDERLELERVPWQDAMAAAERGEIADAKSLVALLWFDRFVRR